MIPSKWGNLSCCSTKWIDVGKKIPLALYYSQSKYVLSIYIYIYIYITYTYVHIYIYIYYTRYFDNYSKSQDITTTKENLWFIIP